MQKRILVHLHLYYHEQLDYFIDKLSNITGCNWELLTKKYSFIQKIFSITNSMDKKHKIITILGIKFNVKYNKIKHIFSIQNQPSTNNKWYKVFYLVGIKFSFRNKRKERRVAEEQEKQFIKNSLNNLVKQNTELKKQNDELKNELKLQQKNSQKQNDELKKQLATQKKEYQYKLHKYCAPEMRAIAIKDWYIERTGEELNLDNPETFNEKIQWLKLYDATAIKTRLADKYLVRDWVKQKIGEEYLIPLLGVWDKFDDIAFDKLPDQFVLKCNHGSAYNIIVTDKSKLNIEEAKRKINSWMQEDYSFVGGFEMHYSGIPRKIIAEEYIKTITDSLQDYKFLCINGNIEIIWVDKDRYSNHKRNLYDKNWNLLNKKINTSYDNFSNCEQPKTFEKMKEFAKLLSKDFCVVRVDFYENNGQLYFGEMTFTTSSGTEDMYPTTLNYELGQLIHLPIEKHFEKVN